MYFQTLNLNMLKNKNLVLIVLVLCTLGIILTLTVKMSKNHIVVHLSSNILPTSPQEVGNSIGNWVTRLSQKLNLSDEWEVALTDISFKKSWYNILDDQRLYVLLLSGDLIRLEDQLPAGNYEIDDLISMINEIFKCSLDIKVVNNLLTSAPSMSYNKQKNKIQIRPGQLTNGEPVYPHFSTYLAGYFGLLDSQGRQYTQIIVPPKFIRIFKSNRDITQQDLTTRRFTTTVDSYADGDTNLRLREYFPLYTDPQFKCTSNPRFGENSTIFLTKEQYNIPQIIVEIINKFHAMPTNIASAKELLEMILPILRNPALTDKDKCDLSVFYNLVYKLHKLAERHEESNLKMDVTESGANQVLENNSINSANDCDMSLPKYQIESNLVIKISKDNLHTVPQYVIDIITKYYRREFNVSKMDDLLNIIKPILDTKVYGEEKCSLENYYNEYIEVMNLEMSRKAQDPCQHYEEPINDADKGMIVFMPDASKVTVHKYVMDSVRKATVITQGLTKMAELLDLIEPIIDIDSTEVLNQNEICKLEAFYYHYKDILETMNTKTRSVRSVPTSVVWSPTFIEGYKEVDLHGPISSLYVYCNIIKPVLVGNYEVPLIARIPVPTEKKFGDNCHKEFNTPHWHPLVWHEINSIEIDIKDDSNNTVDFGFGSPEVSLVFRKKFNNVFESLHQILR